MIPVIAKHRFTILISIAQFAVPYSNSGPAICRRRRLRWPLSLRPSKGSFRRSMSSDHFNSICPRSLELRLSAFDVPRPDLRALISDATGDHYAFT
jgi:hypothetical protein